MNYSITFLIFDNTNWNSRYKRWVKIKWSFNLKGIWVWVALTWLNLTEFSPSVSIMIDNKTEWSLNSRDIVWVSITIWNFPEFSPLVSILVEIKTKWSLNMRDIWVWVSITLWNLPEFSPLLPILVNVKTKWLLNLKVIWIWVPLHYEIYLNSVLGFKFNWRQVITFKDTLSITWTISIFWMKPIRISYFVKYSFIR